MDSPITDKDKEIMRLKEFKRFLDKKYFEYRYANDEGGLAFIKTAYAVFERCKKEAGLC
jgi:hypothetical protein